MAKLVSQIIGGAASRTVNGVSDAVNSSDPGASNTFAFEQVYARLIPFQMPTDGALKPIAQTGGLVFPYNPVISEGVSINYDKVELTHTNEGYHAWKNTENVNITLSDAQWTCDTFENALYALSVLHFFRSYSLMDFGRFKTGRPPSPFWFSAYGNYAFNRVPCIMAKADWTFPNDVDYVGIPNPGTSDFDNGIVKEMTPDALRGVLPNSETTKQYTWLPMIFKVSSINLIVQHTPSYWINFNLEDYWSGKMLETNKGFHITGPEPTLGSAPTTREPITDEENNNSSNIDTIGPQ